MKNILFLLFSVNFLNCDVLNEKPKLIKSDSKDLRVILKKRKKSINVFLNIYMVSLLLLTVYYAIQTNNRKRVFILAIFSFLNCLHCFAFAGLGFYFKKAFNEYIED